MGIVVKATAMLTIVRNYTRYSEYNMVKLSSPPGICAAKKAQAREEHARNYQKKLEKLARQANLSQAPNRTNLSQALNRTQRGNATEPIFQRGKRVGAEDLTVR